jgi:hypothetical protein
MKSLILVSLFLTHPAVLLAKCVAARQVVSYPEDLPNVGMYHRVHPSGQYIIASGAAEGVGENRVAIIDLTTKDAEGKPVAKAVKTPMINETYPVEGTWNLLASPRNFNREDSPGMRYYRLGDVLEKSADAKPVMNDPEHDQWYHSAAELPGSTKDKPKFRTMLYGERYRDYTMSFDKNGVVKESTKSETKRACQNLTDRLASPILSKDGTEVAATNSGKTVIYKIKDDSSCEVVDDLGVYTSKVNFSYPKAGTKGSVVFHGNFTSLVDGVPTAARGVFLYNRDTKITQKLSDAKTAEEYTQTQPSYPGMTKDGRVVYINIKKREIVTVDPNQLLADGSENPDKTKCIQENNSAANEVPAATRRSTTR